MARGPGSSSRDFITLNNNIELYITPHYVTVGWCFSLTNQWAGAHLSHDRMCDFSNKRHMMSTLLIKLDKNNKKGSAFGPWTRFLKTHERKRLQTLQSTPRKPKHSSLIKTLLGFHFVRTGSFAFFRLLTPSCSHTFTHTRTPWGKCTAPRTSPPTGMFMGGGRNPEDPEETHMRHSNPGSV